jgi:DNA-binding CsgD family transcriptional regulator
MSRAGWALGRLELGLGRPDEALGHLLAIADGADGVSHPLLALLVLPEVVEAAARSGRPDAAGRALGTFERFATAARSDWATAQMERMRGLLATGDDAEAHFAASLAATGGRYPLDEARTRLALGEWLRRNRRRVDAREQLRGALRVLEALGAEPWADRARSELRATGAAANAVPSGRLEELTPQELQIARLVADGASNRDIAARLFLSVRTVEYHLKKVYTKLGLASRHALARVVAAETVDGTDTRAERVEGAFPA